MRLFFLVLSYIFLQNFAFSQPLARGYSVHIKMDSLTISKNIKLAFSEIELQELSKLGISVDVVISPKDTTISNTNVEVISPKLFNATDSLRLKSFSTRLKNCISNTLSISYFKKVNKFALENNLTCYLRIYVYHFIKKE